MNKSIMVLCVLACITLSGCSLYNHEDCTFEGVNISMLKVGDHYINRSEFDDNPYNNFNTALIYEVVEIKHGYVLYKFTFNRQFPHTWAESNMPIGYFISCKYRIIEK